MTCSTRLIFTVRDLFLSFKTLKIKLGMYVCPSKILNSVKFESFVH